MHGPSPKAEKAARLNAGKTRAGLDDELVLKIQSKLKSALYGTDAFTYFSRHDKDGSGECMRDTTASLPPAPRTRPANSTTRTT